MNGIDLAVEANPQQIAKGESAEFGGVGRGADDRDGAWRQQWLGPVRHRLRQCGVRFSTNARAPSVASSLVYGLGPGPIFNANSGGTPNDLLANSFIRRNDIGALAAILSAS